MADLRLLSSTVPAEVGISCDRCPASLASATLTMPELEDLLRSSGWLIRDGVDVCPVCRAKI
jgi:hypothetical protein